ncbi:MAG: GNAT family N-acetyltransferase [Lentisphaeria bacterium]|nr:GNAT family N-acetyltransferase [Lentisphaeria bacterium]
MELDGRLIGQDVFVRTAIHADDGREVPIVTMGPICIAPDLQGRGYGKILLDYALEAATALGCGAVCFEGNIGFYGKSGFTFTRNFGLRYHGLPPGTDDSFFLCKELVAGYLDGVTGEYATPQGYLVDEKDADEFDKSFPPKEKLKLPDQLA